MSTTQSPKPEMTQTSEVIQPISAVPAAALTAEQRRKKWEDLRQRMGKSRLEVRGRQGMHYFWAHKTDTLELDRLDLLGYRIVRESNAKDVLAGKAEPTIKAGGLREDGTYIQGDVILLEVEEDVYQYLMMDNEQRSNNQVNAAKDNFIFEAEQQGVPTFEVEKNKKK